MQQGRPRPSHHAYKQAARGERLQYGFEVGGIEPIGPVPAINDGDLAIIARGAVGSRLRRQHREGFVAIGGCAPDTRGTEPGLDLSLRFFFGP